jgi:hypothetical protein
MGIREGREPLFLLDDNNKLIGLCLGADYCAEHEWGIKKTLKDFGVGAPDSPGAVASRKIGASNITQERILHGWYEARKDVFFSNQPVLAAKAQASRKPAKKLAAGFYYDSDLIFHPKSFNKLDDKSDRGVFFGNNTLWTGWSDGSFAAFSIDPDEQAKLKELYEAIKQGDAAIWLGGGGVFHNAGLCIAVASRLPQEAIAEWEKFDKEQANKAAK